MACPVVGVQVGRGLKQRGNQLSSVVRPGHRSPSSKSLPPAVLTSCWSARYRIRRRVGCDYFSAYRKYMRLNDNVTLQFCLAHLIATWKFLAEHPDKENPRVW